MKIHTSVTRRVPRCLALALAGSLLIAASARASACEAEYVGAVSGSWEAPENWKGKALPTSATTVCIGASFGTIVVPNGYTAQADTITAQSGLQIDAGGAVQIARTGSGKENASSFANLIVDGTLSTAGAWIFITGDARVNGTIVGSGAPLVELQSGTLAGTGTIHPQFSNAGGTVEPGGVGTVGQLTFDSLYAQSALGTLALDLASDSSFDRLEVPFNNVFIGGAIEVSTLGGYSPQPGKTWEFIFGSPGVDYEAAVVSPSSFRAFSVPGGAQLELIAPPSSGPQPPTVTATAGDGQATVSVSPPANPGTGAIQSYEFSVQPGAYQAQIPTAGQSTFTGLTNGTTYTVTATVTTTVGRSAPSTPVQFTPQAAVGTGTQGGITKAGEELLLGCSGRRLVLNDVFVRGGRVALDGAAARSLAGKQVKILFGGTRQVASATVGADGRFSTTAALPAARVRNTNKARYLAQIDGLRSLELKLTRRLSLEPPKGAHGRVTLVGRVLPPLMKPRSAVSVSQQLACGRGTVVKRFVPSASGRFHVSFKAPTGGVVAVYRLTGKVANKPGSSHGSATFSLPLPVILG